LDSNLADLWDERHEALVSLNHTELLQLCQRRGLDVHPAHPKESLILLAVALDATTGVEVQVQSGNPIDSWRWGLINFIDEYWQKVQPQITCPARHLKDPDPVKRNPKPCFGCSDMQVLTCVVQSAEKQPRNEQLIRDLRRKPE